MKRHLNTLFVTTSGAYLAKDGETVAVRVDGETKLRLPVHHLGGVVCFGRVGASPSLLGFCAERGVAVTFLSESGRFLAQVVGPTSGNVLLRREQYRRADDPEAAAEIARAVVTAKVVNSRGVLIRRLRESPEATGSPAVRSASQSLAAHARSLGVETDHSVSLAEVRGVEGAAAREYFTVFDHLILHQKSDFRFNGRSRRPPTDPVNSLLSFLYTLLVHDCRAALEAVGLDPAVGFLHRDRPGRPSLALDLMEELRAYLADRLALTLINRRQVQAKGFRRSETGGVVMDDATRKTVLVAWQTRKQEKLRHPFLDEPTTVGLLPHLQALLLARHLRGDLDGYPPFFVRT